jgi:hypothetical protein
MRDEGSSRRHWRRGVLAATFLICGVAGAEPYRFEDLRLGASFQRLAQELDFRDIQAAAAEQSERKAARPDLGRRGFGCARREDPYADVACVSHDERVSGAETREIRLHFLEGRLQQFSITAEIRHYDLVMQTLRSRYGAPQAAAAAPAGGYASSTWRNEDSKIVSYGGKDLVFVSFELAGYPDAVKRKQDGARQQECR